MDGRLNRRKNLRFQIETDTCRWDLYNLGTADLFPVAASEKEKRRPEIRLQFAS